MPDKIYVVGHKSPDLDSVAAAIAYADLQNLLSGTDGHAPAIAGKPNKETAHVLAKFGFAVPEEITNAAGKELLLVDHNESSQAVDGIEGAKITAVLDHHKVNFNYAEPIEFLVKPWGASSTIITQLYLDNNIEITQNMAGLLLSAILIDTVITKSPTSTPKDEEIIVQLAGIAGIPDWQAFGIELFKVRASVGELSENEIIKSDYKDFAFKAGKFGIGQVETVDLGEFTGRADALLFELEKIKAAGGYHTVMLFISDIIKEGSQFLVSTADEAGFEAAFGVKLDNGRVYMPGVLSRKKQVIPKLTEHFDK